MSLLCKIFGHRWQAVYTPSRFSTTGTCMVCLRCRENGWML